LPAVLATGSSTGAIASGFVANSSLSVITVPFLVSARVPPTGVTVSNATHFSLNTALTDTACSALVFSTASLMAASVVPTNASLVGGQGCQLHFNSTSGSLLFTGCEL
jgi:hypothetical protein